MERYTREWLTFHLLKLRDKFWCFSTDEEWNDLLELVRKVGDAVAQIAGMGREEVADLVANKLMVSEAERQVFFERYGVPFESDNICLQMQTSA